MIEITEERYNELLKLAYHDNLTGCYNRNWYFENYNDDSEFMFIMVDINHLKLINDTFGHTVGDNLIKDVAKKLMSFGNVIRFGGDEFILITSKDFDPTLLEDSRYSFGCKFKDKKTTLAECLEIADKDMYKIKNK